MKKEILLIFLLIPFASAISTDMLPEYRPGETMIIKIGGNILEPILSEDVKFLKKGYIEVPFDYDIKRINGEYFLYAVMPFLDFNESVEYTLRIEEVETTVLGKQEQIDFEQNFNVSGDVIEYSVRPGIIIISSENFRLKITSNIDFDQQISIDFPFQREIILSPGENFVDFDIENVGGGFYVANVGFYSIPVLITKEVEKPKQLIDFNPELIDSTLYIGSVARYSFTVTNTGEEIIEEYELIYNEEIVKFESELPRELEPGELYEFDFVLGIEEEIEEIIIIRYGNQSFEFPIFVSYTEREINITIPDNDTAIEYYCSELEGVKCSSSEVCNGVLVNSRDINQCCIGTCIATEEESNFSWIGYIIGAGLIVVLIIVWMRYKKTKKPNLATQFGKNKKIPII